MTHIERAITVAEARERVKAEPKRFKAAVIEGVVPLRDTEENQAVLFRLIKTAEEFLREREAALVAQGFKRRFGTLGDGILLFARGEEQVAVGIDRRA